MDYMQTPSGDIDYICNPYVKYTSYLNVTKDVDIDSVFYIWITYVVYIDRRCLYVIHIDDFIHIQSYFAPETTKFNKIWPRLGAFQCKILTCTKGCSHFTHAVKQFNKTQSRLHKKYHKWKLCADFGIQVKYFPMFWIFFMKFTML